MEMTKIQLENERKIQQLQMQAINALWKKVSCMQNQPITGGQEGAGATTTTTANNHHLNIDDSKYIYKIYYKYLCKLKYFY